ncbi:TetR/AcrR family transcriptional regulator [Streptomyces acidiscabies]|uniref:TetR family transcriptional regulator n=1 Tax=Streptomyces acidiscabies TaxID=42234 RepID=A0AAP6BAW7_9ACTN|nr:TetR/AcrR family transcriptional regulator [Streptomyces acidiscabies]MBP5935169.1 TetR/AcrR family transcriptional regulator [Streptomyces sp. LBUM 1476]MBZ3917016.1 TetR/AcrR family transcriptional regulator [Streptomyces acidiscabies]MDX2961255.1 TetR family transcriptional regulator [Streptomyces acidiscabies]MDX3022613.1 TetR family transcriptional regulator [Streptomyces acidiscabies]MDX3791977.1 TetR family transcriptional regulator [Streptomyces acidiscabies]
MARTKEFDPDAALQSALDLFWRRGYEATSMADLVEHLGIARASIYATFGSKHDLYLKALDRYSDLNLSFLVRELAAPGPALPGVRAVVRRFAAEATGDPDRRRGCLIVNTAAELAPHDPAAARLVEAGWEQLETLLHSALVRAQAQGELTQDRDPRALARMLLVFLQGLRIIGKASTDPTARVRDAVEQALTLLD